VFNEGTDTKRLDLAVLNMVVTVGHKEEPVAIGCERSKGGAGLSRKRDLGLVLPVHLNEHISFSQGECADCSEQVIELAASPVLS